MANKSNRCAIIGCREINSSGNSKENGVSFFTVPKGSLAKWQEVTPSSNLTSKSQVCSRHFDENDVLKGVQMADGFHPYLRWKLRPGALPKHFLFPTTTNNTQQVLDAFVRITWKNSSNDVRPVGGDKEPEEESSLQSINPQKTDVHNMVTKHTQQAQVQDEKKDYPVLKQSPGPPDAEQVDNVEECQPTVVTNVPSSNFVINFATYKTLVAMVKLPECWLWSYDRSQKTICCINTKFLPDGTSVMKAVTMHDSQEVSYYLNGHKIGPIGLGRSFTNFEDISRLIFNFDRKKFCNGVDSSLQDVGIPAGVAGIQNECRLKVSARFAGMLDSGVFRSKNCSILTERKKSCVNCRQFKSYLLKRLRNQPKDIEITKNKCNCSSRARSRQIKLNACRRRIRLLESRAKKEKERRTGLAEDPRILPETENIDTSTESVDHKI